VIPSERAEQSEIRANRALAHFRSQRAQPPAGSASGGLRGWPVEAGEPAYESQDTILRLVAIAEEFSIGRLIDAIEVTLPSDPIVSALWDAELDRSGDTWPKRTALWKKYKRVNVKEFPQHTQLQGFIHARNSIAHGLGALTRRQLRNRTSTTQALRAANIRLHGDRLVIDSTHVEVCALVVKEFVGWLDGSC
jgi:hypothetical protein